jgi:hypothetical protein
MRTATKSTSSGRSVPASKPKQRRIVLFGDSHSDAVQRAIQKRQGKGKPVRIAAHRLLKEKNGGQIGDMSFDAFLTTIRSLDEYDVVLSMIGGNQHAVFSTIQHPQRFDFFDPEGQQPAASDVEKIPYRALEDVFANGLRKGDGRSLEAIRSATRAQVVHIIPPPPKKDNAFIEQHHETLFAKEGLASRGVSSPELRLKFWKLQTRILESICSEIGMDVMLPPRVTTDKAGFLKPEFYAQDATHANWLYGERLLKEIESRYGARPAEPANA